MTEPHEPAWPVAGLDPVRQMRVLSAALPGTGLVERVLNQPYDQVWARVEDMESTVPGFDPLVGSLQIVERDESGEHLKVVARAPWLRVPTRFDVELRPGWCLMQSKVYVVGMAAVPVAEGRTHYAQMEGPPQRWAPHLLSRVMRRVVSVDIDGLERLLA